MSSEEVRPDCREASHLSPLAPNNPHQGRYKFDPFDLHGTVQTVFTPCTIEFTHRKTVEMPSQGES
jgi:hypothetical protein